MAVKVARGQVTIIDQNDAVSLQAFIGSSQPLTQVYNRDNNAYAPSWAASPYLVLTPSLFVSGQAATDQITSVGQCRDAYGRREERLGQVVQERYGDRLRTGQLHHRRGIGQVCPYRQSQPHDRFRSASALYFRGGLHRRQRAGDSVPGGDSVHAAPERRSDDRRRGVCTRRHRIQERRGGDAQGALRPVARSLYRHDERHLRVGHQGFGGIRGHDTDSCRGSRSHDHNGRFGNEHGGGRQDNHRIGTVHHFRQSTPPRRS